MKQALSDNLKENQAAVNISFCYLTEFGDQEYIEFLHFGMINRELLTIYSR